MAKYSLMAVPVDVNSAVTLIEGITLDVADISGGKQIDVIAQKSGYGVTETFRTTTVPKVVISGTSSEIITITLTATKVVATP